MSLGRNGGGFLSRMGGTFGTSDVTVVNKPGSGEEMRRELQAHVQATKAFFNIDAPIWEGDEIHLADPRGGTRVLRVTNVKINEAKGLEGMSHLVVSFSEGAPRREAAPQAGTQVFHGPVVMVSGGQANVAWNGATANGQQLAPISAGYENLAAALTRAMEVLASAEDIDRDDREIGDAAARSALSEITKPEPDRKLIKGALAALRGILTAAATTASGAAVKVLIESLVLS